jgi:hypothetical protein
MVEKSGTNSLEDAGGDGGWTKMLVVGQFESVLQGRGFSRWGCVFQTDPLRDVPTLDVASIN